MVKFRSESTFQLGIVREYKRRYLASVKTPKFQTNKQTNDRSINKKKQYGVQIKSISTTKHLILIPFTIKNRSFVWGPMDSEAEKKRNSKEYLNKFVKETIWTDGKSNTSEVKFEKIKKYRTMVKYCWMMTSVFI